MKINTVIKTMTMALVCLSAATFTSCDNNDNNSKSMKFSPEKVEVGINAAQTVAVANGTTPLTAKSSDEKITTVTVDKTTLTVRGVKAGTATITVTDANKQTGNLAVTVKEMLSFDKAAVSVNTGKEETVTVKSGTAPYSVAVKDSKIATAIVKDAVITVKGVKAGATTVTVTDKNKVTGTIAITVK